MKRLVLTAAALALLLGPAAAHAGWLVEASVGSGFRYDPSPTERTPTNIMIAPGFSFAGMLKLELGVVGNLGPSSRPASSRAWSRWSTLPAPSRTRRSGSPRGGSARTGTSGALRLFRARARSRGALP
jgi:hypothetical protein